MIKRQWHTVPLRETLENRDGFHHRTSAVVAAAMTTSPNTNSQQGHPQGIKLDILLTTIGNQPRQRGLRGF